MKFTMFRSSNTCRTEPLTEINFHPDVHVSKSLLHDLGEHMARSCSWPLPDGSKASRVWGCLSWPGVIRTKAVILDLNPLREGCTTGILSITFTRSFRTVKRLIRASIK